MTDALMDVLCLAAMFVFGVIAGYGFGRQDGKVEGRLDHIEEVGKIRVRLLLDGREVSEARR